MNNSYKITNFTEDNYLNILNYDKETFKEIFTDATKEDYINTNFLIDYPCEAIDRIKGKSNKDVLGIRFVTIDNNFITWCKQNNRPKNLLSIERYTKYISDKDAKKLWENSKKNYDLFLCSLPILLNYYCECLDYSRYYSFNDFVLNEIKSFLDNIFNIGKTNIFIFPKALSKDDAILNTPIIKDYFNNINVMNSSEIKLIKSILTELNKTELNIKYIVLGFKINRPYKMNLDCVKKDANINFNKLLINDEMAELNKILNFNDSKFDIYPVFDGLINIKEIENSDTLLRKTLPKILLN